MRIDELVIDMATRLLAQPADEFVEVWRDGDDWGWRRMVDETPGAAGEIVVQDRVMNGDASPTSDPVAIRSYAADLLQWLQASTTDGS